MSKFNKIKVAPKVINRAGGVAHSVNAEFQLASILLTSFAQNQFYRPQEDTFSELRALIPQVDPVFAMKAAVYARDTFNMRSITHVLAAEIGHAVKGVAGLRSFFDKIVVRPDDMCEIASYYFNTFGEKRPNGKADLPEAMKKGFARAFDRMNGYSLAKYRGDGKGWGLVDLVNLCRPVPNINNAEALRALVAGTLRNTDTWEAQLSSGQDKAEVWKGLLAEQKLGYMALLRNLRNIMDQASDETLTEACAQLVDPERVAKSRQLPFRFVTAYRQIQGDCAGHKHLNKVLRAISKACDLSCSNAPVFENTLVAIDVSGSMMGKPIQQASILGAALLQASGADLMLFDHIATYKQYDPTASVISTAQAVEKAARGGSTNFHSVFQTARRAYDRIIILSDMQGWVGGYSPKSEFNEYKARYNADPYVYSFDLAGYGSLQLPEDKVFLMAGFSEKIFDVMKVLEENRNGLADAIRAVEL